MEQLNFSLTDLGNQTFCQDYNIRYAYVAGAMYQGIASKELVVRMANAGLLSFLGTGGLSSSALEESIHFIQSHISNNAPYGMNFIAHFDEPEIEWKLAELFLARNISTIEASAFMQVSPALVWFRLKGIHINHAGKIITPHRVLAKISRPEVAELFMSPAPKAMVEGLVNEGKLTVEEAYLGEKIPLAQDICVEADSGGHTDQGVAYALMPAMAALKNSIMAKYHYADEIRIGAAGGIGTPEAAAAAFLMGADFIMTGSINQCSVEAGTSEIVKDILQTLNVQDTTYAPAGDLFELGSKVQVVRKGLFFPARANKLYDLYRQYQNLNEIDFQTQQQIQEKYFKRSFDQIWEEAQTYYSRRKPEVIQEAEQNPKKKMALIFRWYFRYTTRLAISGDSADQVNFQIHCGPALGAFNQWVRGTSLEHWRNRHVDLMAEYLMQATAALLSQRYQKWFSAKIFQQEVYSS